VVEPITSPWGVSKLAVIVELPRIKVKACPPGAIVATSVFDELQVTSPVRSRVELSLKVPWAVNACSAPAATVGFAGDTWIDLRKGRDASPHPVKAPKIANTATNRSFFKEHLVFKGSMFS
jgi:hypothetical protein